jgi:putative endonuclease
MSPWFFYILRCSDGTFYSGISDNIVKRVASHNLAKGAKYTRGRLPVELVYQEECENKSAALKREFAVKKLTRKQKEFLVKKAGALIENHR